MLDLQLPACLSQPDFGRTNAHPSEEEELQARQFLPCAENTLQDLQSRIEELLTQIDRCKVAIAPHKRLPEDVLRRIFILSCDETVEFPIDPSLIGSGMVLQLCRVCSAWRKIALKTSSLWCSIKILADYSWSPGSTKKDGAIISWLARACGRPISMELTSPYMCTSLMFNHSHRSSLPWGLISRLLDSYEFRELVFSMPVSDLECAVSLIPECQLHVLERLALFRVNGWENPGRTYNLFSDLSNPFLPNITYLTIGQPWGIQHLQSIFPWEQLQRLELTDGLAAETCIALLQQCSSLEYCAVVLGPRSNWQASASGLTVQSECVTLVKLREVCLKINDINDMETFMDRLVLPGLALLTTETGRPDTDWSLDPIIQFLRKSPKAIHMHFPSTSSSTYKLSDLPIPRSRIVQHTKSATFMGYVIPADSSRASGS
ncbi:hypothetical protein AX15_007821 [Amanita polypyramis BW_CC]|nr:hypothetical protein AX15_007821 [Amanita polypyramis BW_CC]